MPVLHGYVSAAITTDDEVSGRRSANPDGAGNVEMSMMRKRRRVMLPLTFFQFVRRSSCPNVGSAREWR